MKVHLLRCNGALVAVFSTEEKAIAYMKEKRRNGEWWRIEVRDVK